MTFGARERGKVARNGAFIKLFQQKLQSIYRAKNRAIVSTAPKRRIHGRDARYFATSVPRDENAAFCIKCQFSIRAASTCMSASIWKSNMAVAGANSSINRITCACRRRRCTLAAAMIKPSMPERRPSLLNSWGRDFLIRFYCET